MPSRACTAVWSSLAMLIVTVELVVSNERVAVLSPEPSAQQRASAQHTSEKWALADSAPRGSGRTVAYGNEVERRIVGESGCSDVLLTREIGEHLLVVGKAVVGSRTRWRCELWNAFAGLECSYELRLRFLGSDGLGNRPDTRLVAASNESHRAAIVLQDFDRSRLIARVVSIRCASDEHGPAGIESDYLVNDLKWGYPHGRSPVLSLVGAELCLESTYVALSWAQPDNIEKDVPNCSIVTLVPIGVSSEPRDVYHICVTSERERVVAANTIVVAGTCIAYSRGITGRDQVIVVGGECGVSPTTVLRVVLTDGRIALESAR